MVRGISNISIPAISSHSMAGGRKMSFHVDPANLIYSNFQYVSGIAAPNGTYGVTISKLNLLDALIGQLNHAKKDSVPLHFGAPNEQVDVQQLDALIENYRIQVQQARAASEAMPYIPSPSAQAGAVLSLTV